jgi:hypothetical protein
VCEVKLDASLFAGQEMSLLTEVATNRACHTSELDIEAVTCGLAHEQIGAGSRFVSLRLLYLIAIGDFGRLFLLARHSPKGRYPVLHSKAPHNLEPPYGIEP